MDKIALNFNMPDKSPSKFKAFSQLCFGKVSPQRIADSATKRMGVECSELQCSLSLYMYGDVSFQRHCNLVEVKRKQTQLH